MKWLMLGFAFLATVINYLDRQTLSVMAPVILDELHISARGYSHIIFAFMLAYTLGNGVSGRLLDRLGSRIGYGLTIAVWSGAAILQALSGGAFSLGVFRFLLGIGEAGNYPAGVKLIAEWFPVKERSLASGIFNSGASIGAILAPPLLAWIALSAGWRIAFVIVGLTGFVWLAAWALIYRRPEITLTLKAEEFDRVSLRALLRSRFLWQFTLSKVFSDPVWYFYTFWFPQYLKTVHSFSLAQIGKVAWIPFFTASIGNLAGGVVFSGALRWTGDAARARRIANLFFSTLMASGIFIGDGRSSAECIALISIATFGYAGSLANLLAIPGDVFPAGAVASIWGFASMGAGLGGMMFSLVTGSLVDRYSFRPTFMLFGLMPLLAASIVWTLPRKAKIALEHFEPRPSH